MNNTNEPITAATKRSTARRPDMPLRRNMHPDLRAVLDAAADNDLYRINQPPVNEPCNWRRGDGTPVNRDAVYSAVSLGLLGRLASPEQLPDGTWVSRMDLAESVLDDYVTLAGRS